MHYPKSPLNQVKRGHKKASYRHEDVYAILDAVEVCHIAFMYDGRAMVQPINFGRLDDKLYLHGAPKNRMTSAIVEAGEVSVNVMILDAMKLTRSAYHHSVNYRSANIFGTVREVTTDEEKLIGLEAIINHFVPDRWQHCRPPNAKELKVTRVVEITIDTASAKIANSPTQDKEEDLELPYWAGIIPVRQTYGEPMPAPDVSADISLPKHVVDFVKGA